MRRAYSLLALFIVVINFVGGCIKHQPPSPPVADPTIVHPTASPPTESSVDTNPLVGMWHGYMVVDIPNHRVAFLPWTGEGVFDPGGAVEAPSIPTEGNYLFQSPFRSLYVGAVISGNNVAALMPLGETCTAIVPAYPYADMPGFSLHAGGVGGMLYKTVLAEGKPVMMVGDCTRVLGQ